MLCKACHFSHLSICGHLSDIRDRKPTRSVKPVGAHRIIADAEHREGRGPRRKAGPRGYQDSCAPLARSAVPVTTRLQPRWAVFFYIASLEVNVLNCRDDGAGWHVTGIRSMTSACDAKVVPGRIEDPEVFQAPRTVLQFLVQRPARRHDPITLIHDIVDLQHQLHSCWRQSPRPGAGDCPPGRSDADPPPFQRHIRGPGALIGGKTEPRTRT